jgi:hypothetical protein
MTPEEQARADEEELRKRSGAAYTRQTFEADPGAYDASRRDALSAAGSMQEATDMARKAAMGDPNSVAQQQLRQGLQRGKSDARTVASMARGGGLASAAAARRAADAGTDISAGGVAQSAALGAREQAQGRADLAALTGAQRDFGQGLQAQDQDWASRRRDLQAEQEEQRRAFGRGLGRIESGVYSDEVKRRAEQDRIDHERAMQTAKTSEARKGAGLDLLGGILGGAGTIFKGAVGGNSDERTKEPAGLAVAAARRRGY